MSEQWPPPNQQPGPSSPPPGQPWPPPVDAATGARTTPPPGQAWAPPPAYAGQPPTPRPTFPHAEPTPYHQMLRTHTYAVWKPLVGILLAVVGFLLLQFVLIGAVVVVWSAFEAGPFLDNLETNSNTDKISPALLLGINVGLASLILLSWFLVRVLHGLRPRWLTSVAPRMRWRLFAACLGLALVALVVQVLAAAVLPVSDTGEVSGKLNDFTTTTAVFAVVMLLTTPLQAAGEEYLFRGYGLQVFGSLVANRRVAAWVAVIVTALVFATVHGSQNFPLFFDRFMFGLVAGWLVIRTGGLEAGIALHVVNNLLALGIALAYGDLSTSLNVSEISWWNVPLTLAQSAIYAALVVWVARRMGLRNETQPPREDPDARPETAVATA